ncbi:2OG-Fe(II) oxygenase [Xenorhabdus bovienii]|uniref:2OG-Fe(II) oxygenase n=1 Tax=Xenorhabdus bovienii TaxID=40576 RepID=UPI0023B2E7B3|nr:2OG-Fe(II) oxygenase [Xenorhabdus bovienii]MDE9541069.1 2OG-Fe(II) oxygenase [Xenorhabdus bovienii]
MINYEALLNAHVSHKPYKIAVARDIFTDPDILSLNYPDQGFIAQSRMSLDKEYKFSVNEMNMEKEIDFFNKLSPCWVDFFSSVTDERYFEAIKNAVGIDVSQKRFKFGFYKYAYAGDWVSPHKDKPEKILTHVMFFNKKWHSSNGGQFLALGSSAMDDAWLEVEPVVGNSVFFQPTDNSWHAVKPLTGPHGRLSIQIEYFYD